MTSHSTCLSRPATLAPLALLAALFCAHAVAQYKVVQPDGSVLYSDKPPSAGTSGRVTTLGKQLPTVSAEAASGASAKGEPTRLPVIPLDGLPAELRAAVQRYPVTLFSSSDCAACDSGRRLLVQRGVPFAERQVASDDDLAALERQWATRQVPLLTIGPQPMRRFAAADWNNYLDAAGYPPESKLPRGWKAPPASPLAVRTPATVGAAEAPPAATTTPAPAPRPTAAPPGTIRF